MFNFVYFVSDVFGCSYVWAARRADHMLTSLRVIEVFTCGQEYWQHVWLWALVRPGRSGKARRNGPRQEIHYSGENLN